MKTPAPVTERAWEFGAGAFGRTVFLEETNPVSTVMTSWAEASVVTRVFDWVDITRFCRYVTAWGES